MTNILIATDEAQDHIVSMVIDPDLWSEVEVIMIPPRLRLQLGHMQTWEWEHWHAGRSLRTTRRGFTNEHDCRGNAEGWAMMSDLHDRALHRHHTKVRMVFCWAFLITDLDGNVVEFQIGFNYAEDAKRASREWMREVYTSPDLNTDPDGDDQKKGDR